MKNLKITATLIAFIFCSQFSNAQTSKKLENSVLWKIEHPEMKKASYLFGTVHLMCEEDFKLPEKVEKTLQNVDALVVEVNFSDPTEMASMQKAMQNPKKISEEISAAQFQELDQLVTRVTGAALSNFDVYGISMLNGIMVSKMLPCTQIKLPDNELSIIASQLKKPIYSFEKAAQQVEIMRKAYPTDFALKQILLFDSYKKDFSAALIAYKKENISTTVQLLTKEEYMDDNATEIMQTSRNKSWVEKMPQMMKSRSNLFAVGAAHLLEDYGLINLLRQKGYTVTPVFN